MLAPTRKASFQESNSLLQAKSFWGFFRPVSSNRSCQVMCIHSNQGFALSFKSSSELLISGRHGVPELDRMSLWLYFFLLSTPMSANEQLFLLIFFRARCNDLLAAQIFCRELK